MPTNAALTRRLQGRSPLKAQLECFATVNWKKEREIQTNGTGGGLPPNINDMLNAVQRLKDMSPVPPKEFKLHPDDYAELKLQAAPYLPHPMPGIPDSFAGLKIVIDATAERLPRKTPSNAGGKRSDD